MILNLPPSVRIWAAAQPVDMRKAFDGLSAAVMQVLGKDPLSGHLFVFVNRASDRVKVLWYDGNGYALYYKRLERGRFHLFAEHDAGQKGSLELRAADLALILQGIDLRGAKRRRAWTPPVAKPS